MSAGGAALDPAQGAPPALEELVDRPALGEVLASFYALFHIPVRLLDPDGVVVADARAPAPEVVCQYVDGFPRGRALCEATVAGARSASPPADREVTHGCFTGAAYRIFPVVFDTRVIGRVVLGPYLPADVRAPPRSLLVIDPAVEPGRAQAALAELPRVRPETAAALVRHLRSVLDVILFAGHRALLTSEMHVAAVRDSFRELEDKTDELARSYERLKHLDRLKSAFLATVSHELRTPLTSILGYSEMLAEGAVGPLNDEQAEYVATIREKGRQLHAMITSLLDLGRLEQGAAALAPAPVSLASLAAEVVADLADAARRRRVELALEADPAAPPALGDRERLRQVLVSLVDNAVKFSPGGGRVLVRVGAIDPTAAPDGADDGGLGFALLAPARPDVEVRVRDSGVGIPEHARPHVFEPFYQADSGTTRQFGGAGLGLAIVKRIVDAHHGEVFAEPNAQAPGTTFVVRLPGAHR